MIFRSVERGAREYLRGGYTLRGFSGSIFIDKHRRSAPFPATLRCRCRSYRPVPFRPSALNRPYHRRTIAPYDDGRNASRPESRHSAFVTSSPPPVYDGVYTRRRVDVCAETPGRGILHFSDKIDPRPSEITTSGSERPPSSPFVTSWLNGRAHTGPVVCKGYGRGGA